MFKTKRWKSYGIQQIFNNDDFELMKEKYEQIGKFYFNSTYFVKMHLAGSLYNYTESDKDETPYELIHLTFQDVFNIRLYHYDGFITNLLHVPADNSDFFYDFLYHQVENIKDLTQTEKDMIMIVGT